jgi:hypothetical protein
MQSHKCAHLDACGDQCHADEYCQYKFKPYHGVYPYPVICCKDQFLELQKAGVL